MQRQKDKERPFAADHHARIWDDLATLLRAKAWAGREASAVCLRDPVLPSVVAPEFWFPALVLDAPLYTYDIGTRVVAPVDRLTLWLSVDTSHEVFADEVDVVTLTGLESLVDDYVAAVNDIQSRMTPHVELVRGASATRGRNGRRTRFPAQRRRPRRRRHRAVP